MTNAATTAIEAIKQKIIDDLPASSVEIEDDSWKHVGHAGAMPGNLHLTITVVSDQFNGVSLIDQHRMVQQVLKDEIGTIIHALILKTKTA